MVSLFFSFFFYFFFLKASALTTSPLCAPLHRFVTLRVDRRKGKDGVSLILTCEKDVDTTVLARVVFEFRHRHNPRLSLFRSSSSPTSLPLPANEASLWSSSIV